MNCYAIKSIGYVISSISVALLGIVAWEAADEGWMRPLVLVGVLASIVGMALRWLTYREDKRQRGELAPGPGSAQGCVLSPDNGLDGAILPQG